VSLLPALKRLQGLVTPSFTTRDAAALLEIAPAHASQTLRRLSLQGQLLHLGRGRWALAGAIDRYALPEALTAPRPAYVSLYTALYHYSFVEQIPDVIYAVTLAPTRRAVTPAGVVSLHQVAPTFFTGFEQAAPSYKIALPEKALVDTLYLRPARSKLFRALPELELPRRFSAARARQFTKLIEHRARRTLVEHELELILARARRD